MRTQMILTLVLKLINKIKGLQLSHRYEFLLLNSETLECVVEWLYWCGVSFYVEDVISDNAVDGVRSHDMFEDVYQIDHTLEK